MVKTFLKLFFATSLIYFLGMMWLGSLIGWEKPIFQLGVVPFIYAELFKVLLLTFLATNIIKIRNQNIIELEGKKKVSKSKNSPKIVNKSKKGKNKLSWNSMSSL